MPRVGQNPNRSADAERFESTFVAVITHLPNTTTAYHAKRFEVVRACLTTMRENAKMPHTFIVWDNGSEQTFRNWLQDVFRPDVLILSKNVGKVTARTTLGRMIPPEAVIAISDDDMLYEDDWLVPQIELLQHFPNVACVSGYAVRTAFRWGVENTLAWARKHALLEQGRFMSRERENDFAVSIGRDPAWHEAYTKDDVDYRVTYNGKSAYCTAHHCQFVTTGETIRKLPQYDDKALGEERSFDIGMDALGLRLSTINRLSRHIGNVMDESMRKTIGV